MDKIELALKHIQQPFWFVKLTDRESEAVRLASLGYNIPDVVAPCMNITPKSVYRLLHNATEKIGDEIGEEISFGELPNKLFGLIEEVLSDERE